MKKKRLEEKSKETEKSNSNNSQSNQSQESNLQFLNINKYAFDNEGAQFKIYITTFNEFKSHPKEKIIVTFNNNSFELKILDWNKTNYKLAFNNLYNEIIPSESTFSQTKTGVIIKLKKVKEEVWSSVEKKKHPHIKSLKKLENLEKKQILQEIIL